MFSESSTTVMQLPCCPGNYGELSENCLQNLRNDLMADSACHCFPIGGIQGYEGTRVQGYHVKYSVRVCDSPAAAAAAMSSLSSKSDLVTSVGKVTLPSAADEDSSSSSPESERS